MSYIRNHSKIKSTCHCHYALKIKTISEGHLTFYCFFCVTAVRQESLSEANISEPMNYTLGKTNCSNSNDCTITLCCYVQLLSLDILNNAERYLCVRKLKSKGGLQPSGIPNVCVFKGTCALINLYERLEEDIHLSLVNHGFWLVLDCALYIYLTHL